MQTQLKGGAAFGHLHITLDPGESILTENGAMQSMDADLDMDATLAGGLGKALKRAIFGGERMVCSSYSNNASLPKTLTIAPALPGQVVEFPLAPGETLCLQKGAWLASAGDVNLSTVWAGMASAFAGEGLGKLRAVGGKNGGVLWFSAYGGMVERQVNGEILVDGRHLAAYEEGFKLSIGLPGKASTAFFGGEGFVTRIQGNGTIWMQTRSVPALAHFLNPRFS
ncbi:MAG: TIGR00266 family protein [Spirochaetales bacterium]|nr:TIGR00266 family protein [Spirochaetales bacterium]